MYGGAPASTGAGSTIDSEDLAVSRAVVSSASGKIEVSDVTSTELGYLDGVTSMRFKLSWMGNKELMLI